MTSVPRAAVNSSLFRGASTLVQFRFIQSIYSIKRPLIHQSIFSLYHHLDFAVTPTHHTLVTSYSITSRDT